MEKNIPIGVCGDKKNDLQGRIEDAKIFDTAFFLMGLFHIIEWIRTIILLTSTCMGGVFLI